MSRLYLSLIIFVLFVARIASDNFQTKTERIKFNSIIDGKNYKIEAMLYYPLDKKNQHPLIIVTHGRSGPTPKVNENEVTRYRNLNLALSSKGYLVMLLVRRGYGNSEGPDSEYLDTPEESAFAGAKDIKGAINFMKTKPDIIKEKIVIIGQSQGGWISLASSTLEIDGILGVINISGAINFRQGLKKSIRSQEVESKLENSAKIFGKMSHVPSLWIYTENDNHFPDSVKRWYKSFIEAGGKGNLIIKPRYKDNGHSFFNEPNLYLDDILKFFKEINF